MADDIDLRLAEIENENRKIALQAEMEKTAQAKADASGRKSEGWLKFVVGGIIGGIVAYTTAYFEYSGRIKEAEFEYQNRDREIDLELARLSLTILSGEYDKDDVENSLPARMFALRALATGTGVVISDEDMDTWARTGVTPASKDDVWGVTTEVYSGLGWDEFKFAANNPLRVCVKDENEQKACGPLSRYIDFFTACVAVPRKDELKIEDICGEIVSIPME